MTQSGGAVFKYIADSRTQDFCLLMGEAIPASKITFFTARDDVGFGVSQSIIDSVTPNSDIGSLTIITWLALNIFSKPRGRQITSESFFSIIRPIGNDMMGPPAALIKMPLLVSLKHFLAFGSCIKPSIFLFLIALSELCSGTWSTLIAKTKFSIFVSREKFSGRCMRVIADVATAPTVIIRSICHMHFLQCALLICKQCTSAKIGVY